MSGLSRKVGKRELKNNVGYFLLFFHFDLKFFAYSGVIVGKDIAFISISSFNITNMLSPCNNVYLWWICVSIFIWILKIWGKIKPWKDLENGGTAYSLCFRLVWWCCWYKCECKVDICNAYAFTGLINMTWFLFYCVEKVNVHKWCYSTSSSIN